ncbi:MAG TPA: DNA-3-methyladenine glycosylase 2 family protein, partial [Saprospiraceae bacterium]|nr:DNA-3-methyladenine glycosylase 2 family protein [Saprospiraceae bacterium]
DPSPEDILRLSTEEKRAIGLSYQKAGYMDNIAGFWIENSLASTSWQSMSDDEILSLLTQIKGVGKWTVEMVLIFSLLRPNVFPYDDLGIKQQVIKLYGLESTGKQLIKDMNEVAERWKPYRSFASRYIWKSKDLAWKD